MDREISSIIFDFDSTLVAAEGIEMLVEAGLVEADAGVRKEKLTRLKEITRQTMNGELPFARALEARLQLAQITHDQVQQVSEEIQKRLNPQVKETILALSAREKDIFVFSGGFRELVTPVTRLLGIPDDRTFANTLIYDGQNRVVGVEQHSPLVMSSGKVFLAEKLRVQGVLRGKTIVVGDGFSDLAIRKLRVADIFVYFSGNVNREDIRREADFVIDEFNKLVPLIERLEGNKVASIL